MHDKAGTTNSGYIGYDGARKRFLKFFPNGFQSDGFAAKERDYKIAAKAKLDETAPLEKALDEKGLGEAVLAVFQATNMLSPFEKTRLQDMLRGSHADDFIKASAHFTLDSSEPNLLAMRDVLKPHDNMKWPVVTYLPYLWQPEKHMFLKPQVTKDYAERVGHNFADDYEPQLSLKTYQSLLALADRTAIELKNLKPRDQIDIQSLIWVVGGYQDEREETYP
ncbi:hypothetical protein JCM17846_20510 [Iodidimonas nitroreducens]|uniref:Uncharacterized protein n=1 Tax=Iodidimonas nitroreducens TaxID=1236968 RepID=A0A5A7NBE6_9PROT|nr:hypothetical protein [Iodidimonas nitroreducens]GER04369.1 hypothetical protein JCM17846_20510 [Iodidimonas nitroreducens]